MKNLRRYESAMFLQLGGCHRLPTVEELAELASQPKDTIKKDVKIELVPDSNFDDDPFKTMIMEQMVRPTTLIK